MKLLRVLIACEYSGTVRDAFTKLGHYAMSCDLLPTESPGLHYQGDIMDIMQNEWDLMVAHPPCTNLAVSANKWYKPENLHHDPAKPQKRADAIEFFMKLANANINHIAIENPKCIMSGQWRKADQVTQPFHFGDPIRKEIHLWLKDLPKLIHTDLVEPEDFFYNSKRTKSGKSRYSKFGKLGSGKGKERSVFFPRIAEQMAIQWSEYILNLKS